MPVELAGETCTYDVGNDTTRVKIQFQNSENQQQLLSWGLKAQMTHVGWVFRKGFVEEVNLRYSGRGLWNSSKIKGIYRTVNWVSWQPSSSLGVLSHHRQQEVWEGAKAHTRPDPDLPSECPPGSLCRHSCSKFQSVSKVQKPCRESYFLAHWRNSISYQNHFSSQSSDQFLTEWFEENQNKKDIKPFMSFSSDHLNLESMMLKENKCCNDFYVLHN